MSELAEPVAGPSNRDPDINTSIGEVDVEVEHHIALVTINRPKKLNTLTPAMGRELMRISGQLNADEDVRVVVLRGAGDRAFSAGSDITALDAYGDNWQLRNRVDYARAIWAIRKPVIAEIHGWCIGGGLEMALMSDIRISAPSAKFAAGEIKLGWHGGAGNTQLLPRVVGPGQAALMLLTGDPISADEAFRVRLVDRVVDEGNLHTEVMALAGLIASRAPIAAQVAKHLIRISQSTSLDVGLSYENDTFAYLFTTHDSSEGRTAFLEKRQPRFTGR